MGRSPGRKGVSLPYPWIDGLTRRQQHQIWSDFQALANLGRGTRWATLVIAASDSTAAGKRTADFVCNGSNDAALIQEAVDELESRQQPGRIVFLEGTYTLDASITVDINDSQDLVFQGMGAGHNPSTSSNTANCKIVGPGTAAAFVLNGVGVESDPKPHHGFIDLSIDGGAHYAIFLSHNHYAHVTINNCTLTGTRGFSTSDSTLGSNVGVLKVSDTSIQTSDYGIYATSCQTALIDGNMIESANGVVIGQYGGFVTPGIVSNNHITVTGTYGVWVTTDFSTFAENLLITGNNIRGDSSVTGVYVNRANNCMVSGNLILSCSIGIDLEGGSGAGGTGDNLAVIGNELVSCTTGVALRSTGGTGLTRPSVVANVARGATTALAIEAGVQNAVDLANDWGGSTVTDSGTDSTHYSPGDDFDEVAMLRARINSGTAYERHQINFIEGQGVTLTVNDDSVGDEVEVTIEAPGALAAVAAQGDLIVGIAAGEVDNLPIDRDGQLLVSDSSTYLGVKWGPKLTVSQTEPSSPKPGDIWVELP